MVTQVPTVPTTIVEIMMQPTFVLGVIDGRAHRPIHHDYDLWDINGQWDYERGRMWAAVVPRQIPLKLNGRLNPTAVTWFARHRDDII
jgi:hypothetical protein